MNASSHESEWAADRKVGFALGILLVGVVAALFFRNEPLEISDVPAVNRAEEIDVRLRDRNVNVYSDTELTQNHATQERQIAWTHPAILQDVREVPAPAPLAIGQTDFDRESDAPAAPVILPAATCEHADDSALVRAGQSLAGSISTTDSPDFVESAETATEYEEYTIQYGDTLSGIANQYLGSPNRYGDIYEANRDRMSSPDHLRVGTAIRIPRLQ